MNFIMGLLLIVSGAQESLSFNCFISFLFRKEYMIVGLFETGFPLLRFLEFIFEQLFCKELPELYKHFKEQDIQNTVWLTKWLMTLYLYSFSITTSIRIMDFMISTNIFALVFIAIEILSTLQQQFLKMDSIDIVTFFSRKNSTIDESSNNNNNSESSNFISLDQINIDEIIDKASKYSLSNKEIRRLARECREEIIVEYQQLISGAPQNQTDEDILRNYAAELSRIGLFIHYYTLQGKTEEQTKYHNMLTNQYINQEVIEKHKLH